MAELEINLFTLIFGVLIFGLGYIGIFTRYIFFNKNFYELYIWDKIIQSFILGTLSFLLTNKTFISIKDYSEKNLLEYALNNPSIFIYQFFYVIIIVYALIMIELYVKMIIKITINIDKKKKMQ